jgi:hypothetical protein
MKNKIFMIAYTKEQFHNFSYYDLAWFWINHKLVIEETENGLRLWAPDHRVGSYAHNHRLKPLKKFKLEQAEMGCIDIPRDNSLFEITKSKLKSFFFKPA